MELAIVSTFIAPLLLYVTFLEDVIQIKLKVQEAARYMAWEFTAWELSDYRGAEHWLAFDKASNEVLNEAAARYRFMDSSLPGVEIKHLGFEYDQPVLSIQNEEISYPGDSLRTNLKGLGPAAGMLANPLKLRNYIPDSFAQLVEGWGFNTRGVVRVSAQLTVRNKMIPEKFLNESWYKGTHLLFPPELREMTFTEEYALLADSWKLQDGKDVRPGQTDSPYYAQVDRMAFQGMKDVAGLADVKRQALVGSLAEIDRLVEEPLTTKLASLNYRKRDDKSGMRDASAEVDRGVRTFDTAPVQDIMERRDAEFYKTFMKRGSHYMGCETSQTLSCL